MKKTNQPLYLSMLAGFLLFACQTPESKTVNTKNPPNYRDKIMCTAQYDPICATIVDDSGKTVRKTFSNACHASAAGVKILSEVTGACL